MTLQSSGAISLSNIASEMGGSTPHSLSEYYKGGGLVANHSNNPNVPTSGTISLSNFYGANNTAPGATSHNHALVVGNGGNVILGPVGYQQNLYGSLSNNPQSIALTTGLRMNIVYAYWDLMCNKATFYMRYTALAGPADGTGWSAINTGFDGNRTRSEYSITVNQGLGAVDLFALWTAPTGTGPAQGSTQNMVVTA